MRRLTYIHELPDWPKFTWDSAALAPALSEVRHKQGRLLGRMEGLGFELRREASLATLISDVVKSSAIEGEHLNPEEVRSSIARQLGLEVGGLAAANRDVDGIVEMMLDATQHYEAPLTRERLFDWHAALFPTGRSGMRRIVVGAWRGPDSGPMRVVSGAIGKERVHFEAPKASRLAAEMKRFVTWIEARSSVDWMLRAGVAHLWFVTIHPFEDGNGRIARAIADMALSRSDGSKERFYSMSSQVEKERKAYYDQLERQQSGSLDITPWLEWFLACLDRAVQAADESLSAVLYRSRLWERINRATVNQRQRSILHRMLGDFEGFLNTSKYAKLTKCSSDTALRDIQDLVEKGILLRNEGGGRSTSYRLGDLDSMRS